jgi:hypothetical protein
LKAASFTTPPCRFTWARASTCSESSLDICVTIRRAWATRWSSSGSIRSQRYRSTARPVDAQRQRAGTRAHLAMQRWLPMGDEPLLQCRDPGARAPRRAGRGNRLACRTRARCALRRRNDSAGEIRRERQRVVLQSRTGSRCAWAMAGASRARRTGHLLGPPGPDRQAPNRYRSRPSSRPPAGTASSCPRPARHPGTGLVATTSATLRRPGVTKSRRSRDGSRARGRFHADRRPAQAIPLQCPIRAARPARARER